MKSPKISDVTYFLVLFLLDTHDISIDMQRNHLIAGSMCVVSLEEVVIFGELCVFLGFCSFQNEYAKLIKSQTYVYVPGAGIKQIDLETLRVWVGSSLKVGSL